MKDVGLAEMSSKLLVSLVLLIGCDVHSKDEVQLVQRVDVASTASTASGADTISEPKRIADGGRIVLPTVLKRVDPVLPETPRTALPILVEALVSAEGEVRDVRVVQGGENSYTRAVVLAVKQWQFRPGTVDGKAVDMPLQLTVNINAR